ncbi:MAG: HAMP domain-containing histidine kinase [Lachnospiraceae bacterium]|nr:HAMP domain-containing histidine kinase [Lachnospiraceae bacterium]
MSSNQSNEKRVTSISHKFQWLVVKEKLLRALGNWVGLTFLLFAAFIAEREYSTLGGWFIHYGRSFSGLSNLESVTYVVTDLTGKIVLSEKLFPLVYYVLGVTSTLFTIRLVDVLVTISKDNKRIKAILSPIYEITAKADELSKLEFSEDKYQLLEDAIDHIEPSDNKTISLNSSELQGIENAMNNLITRMKESYKQQARFVNDASHELRTPIAVIEGYANMLSRWGREDEKVLDESISAIKNESSHMKHLVEQLLFLARGDSGKTTLKVESASLNDIMQEIYEESLMIDENHPYRFTKWGDELIAEVDPGMIKQAVRILIDNAAKYTLKGDEIHLSTGINEEGRMYLQVQDNGIGMAQKDVEHMFERFYRADEARNTEGTGLGLSIAKWIVDKHKGYFAIVSRPEIGTRIRIIL